MPTSHAAVVSQEQPQHPNERPHVPQVCLALPPNLFLMYAAFAAFGIGLLLELLVLMALIMTTLLASAAVELKWKIHMLK